MVGNFSYKKFSDINIEDHFFDSLKADYPGTANSTGFIEWFKKKSASGSPALVFEDESGIQAFIALKQEEEKISLQDGTILPPIKRMKISTFRISDKYPRQRIGEGAIGLILWRWQQSHCSEIYVTVFEKHTVLLSLFEKFGFKRCGFNRNGEIVLSKNRFQIDFSNPYTAFPFIKNNFRHAGYIIIDDTYHDTMFAYSELANHMSLHTKINSSVSNGLSKIYVGKAPTMRYYIGEPILVYRKYTKGSGKRYHSCITSYCIVTDIIKAKSNYRCLMSFDDLKGKISNKSVFNEEELFNQYQTYKNVTVVGMLYYGYFGAKNNVNLDWLDRNGLWASENQYPTEIRLSDVQFKKVLVEGNINVSNVIID